MENKDLHKIADDFFKSPCGTTLHESSIDGSQSVYAVKFPLGEDDRFSTVMAGSVIVPESGNIACPSSDWTMRLDSYVDSETGFRIKSGATNQFFHAFDYEEGVFFDQVYDEIRDAVTEKIAALSDAELISYIPKNIDDPAKSFALQDADLETIEENCREAYLLSKEPRHYGVPKYGFPSMYNQTGNFALDYMRDKKGLIESKFDELIPKVAAACYRNRLLDALTRETMSEIEAKADPELRKAREIYEAIKDKDNVYTTIYRGDETLCMLIPTECFYSALGCIDTFEFSLTAERAFMDFMRLPYNEACPHISLNDVILIYHGNECIYVDEAFYAKQQERNDLSLEARVNDAQDRAAKQISSSKDRELELSL